MDNIQLEKYKTWLLSNNSDRRDDAVNIFSHTETVDEEIDNILISLLRTDDNKHVRRSITHLFIERADKKFLQSFFDALQDDDSFVRGNAYLGLIKLGVSENHELLVEYRNDSNHDFERFCINESKAVCV